MASIRVKIEGNPGDPQYIKTEVGVGYRMIDEWKLDELNLIDKALFNNSI